VFPLCLCRCAACGTNPRQAIIAGVLELITAVVVGAILDLTLFLGKAVIFHQGRGFQAARCNLSGLGLLSLFLLQRVKLKIIPDSPGMGSV